METSSKLLGYMLKCTKKEVCVFLADEKHLSKVMTLLASLIEGENEKMVALLKAVLEGIDSNHCNDCRLTQVYKKTITQLCNCKLIKIHTELIGLLLLKADQFDEYNVVCIIEFLLDLLQSNDLKNGSILDIFSKLLSDVTYFEKVPVHGDSCGQDRISGVEFKSQTLNHLFTSRWKSNNALHMTSMFRSLDMNKSEFDFVVGKSIRMLNEVDIDMTPNLVTNLLLLSNKGSKQLILNGICSFFNKQNCRLENNGDADEDDEEEQFGREDNVLHSHGLAITNFLSVVKQDQEIGREFMKYIKSLNTSCMSVGSFTVYMSLSLANNSRLKEQVFDFLKSTTSKHFQEKERRSVSKWIQSTLPANFNIETAIYSSLSNGSNEMKEVINGLIPFSFELVKCHTNRNTGSSQKQMSKFGSQIISKLFKVHHKRRTLLFNQLLNIMVTCDPKEAEKYQDLLSSIVKFSPQIVFDCIVKVREVLDHLVSLPPSIATGLLKAILPFMKVSARIKDNLMMVLRKALFSKHVNARKVALTGYLLILKHFKVESSSGLCFSQCSQIAATQSFAMSQLRDDEGGILDADVNQVLCLEILGSVKKCLSQQADVRLSLYDGFYEVLCRNSQLAASLLELLMIQFKRFYKPESDVIPPLKFDPALSYIDDKLYLVDPLAHLLNCLQLCTTKAGRRLDKIDDEDSTLSAILDEAEDMLTSLTRRMIKSELEDFGLDKAAEFSIDTNVGIKNTIVAKLTLGVLEALIEYIITKDGINESTCEHVSSLFVSYSAIDGILKEKNSTGKKGKLNSSSKCLISLKTLSMLASIIVSDNDEDKQIMLSSWRDSPDLLLYLFQSSIEKMTEVKEKRRFDGAGGDSPDHIFRQCCTLGSIFLQQLNGDTCLSKEVMSKKDKVQRIVNVCLDGLNLVTEIVCQQFPSRIEQYLPHLEFSSTFVVESAGFGLYEGELTHRSIKSFQCMALSCLTRSQDTIIGIKGFPMILNMIASLTDLLPRDSEQFKQVYTWLHKLCKEQTIGDVLVFKGAISLLLRFHHETQSSTSVIREMSQDIHSRLGDIDEEIEVETSQHFKCITEKMAAPSAFASDFFEIEFLCLKNSVSLSNENVLLMSHCESIIDEGEWMVTTIRGMSCSSQSQDGKIVDDETRPAESIEASLCHRIKGLVMVFHEITQSAYPERGCFDSITKVLSKFYQLLGTFVKYYIALYVRKAGHVSGKFEKMITLTGTHLAQQVYAMISYLQASQSSIDNTALEKPKSKKPKKGINGKNRALKESRLIPELIFTVEQYERQLIILSKKSKINLMEHFKRSTSRDFRINGAALEAALSRDSDDEAVIENSDCENDENQPPSKKSMLSSSNAVTSQIV